jgi:hypothetical protein
MSHARTLWLKFHADLFAADLAAAERIRSEGCSRCRSGRLCVANYPRKARGLDDEAEGQGRYDLRLSFCCSRDGCRRRTTPPSVRFLGRHVYVAVRVLLAVSASSGAAPAAPATPPPARQTRRRWRSFWQERLLGSAVFIEMIASRMTSPLESAEMPDALLDRLRGDRPSRVFAMLRLLAPWTTLSASPESARSAMVP